MQERQLSHSQSDPQWPCQGTTRPLSRSHVGPAYLLTPCSARPFPVVFPPSFTQSLPPLCSSLHYGVPVLLQASHLVVLPSLLPWKLGFFDQCLPLSTPILAPHRRTLKLRVPQ